MSYAEVQAALNKGEANQSNTLKEKVKGTVKTNDNKDIAAADAIDIAMANTDIFDADSTVNTDYLSKIFRKFNVNGVSFAGYDPIQEINQFRIRAFIGITSDFNEVDT